MYGPFSTISFINSGWDAIAPHGRVLSWLNYMCCIEQTSAYRAMIYLLYNMHICVYSAGVMCFQLRSMGFYGGWSVKPQLGFLMRDLDSGHLRKIMHYHRGV